MFYVIFIPHEVKIEHISNASYDAVIETISLSIAEFIKQVTMIFLAINIPNIVIGIKRFNRFVAVKLYGENAVQ